MKIVFFFPRLSNWSK